MVNLLGWREVRRLEDGRTVFVCTRPNLRGYAILGRRNG